MKFCPQCGAALPGGAAPFCPECGKKLKEPARGGDKKHRTPHRRNGQEVSCPDGTGQDQQDEAYDGYYDDVAPVDADQAGDRIDPALIKRILLVILGTVGVITLAAVLMFLL